MMGFVTAARHERPQEDRRDRPSHRLKRPLERKSPGPGPTVSFRFEPPTERPASALLRAARDRPGVAPSRAAIVRSTLDPGENGVVDTPDRAATVAVGRLLRAQTALGRQSRLIGIDETGRNSLPSGRLYPNAIGSDDCERVFASSAAVTDGRSRPANIRKASDR